MNTTLTPFKQLFQDDFFFPERLAGKFSPAVDIIRNKFGFEIKADLPGVSKENLQVIAEGKELTISGSRAKEVRDDKDQVHTRAERADFSEFERRFSLDTEALDTSKIEATLKDGILSVKIPFKEQSLPRQITVNVT
jgi:HSP20 family molecular chaperone IbpA